MSKKFSQFVEGEIPRITDIIVGLRDGDNTQFNYSGVNDEYDNPIVSYESYNEFGRNYIRFVNSPMGLPVLIQAQGIDADVGLTVSSKANGNLTLTSPNAGDVNITIGGSGDINFSTNAGRIYLNATDPLYGFTNDDTFAGASAEYAPSALAVKTYVDSHIATSNFFISTLVATTGNLNATYDNGVAGIGATLTANSNGAASIDGISLSLGDIVLFKDQTSALENGVYSVIQVGSVGTPAIYERYIYFDESAEIKQGYTTFTVQGTVNAKKGYQVVSVVNNIGVDDINYQQITIPSITSSTDNAIVRFDGASGGQIQNSGITISDADILSGATQINVDNLRLDGNILSSTDINGPVTIDPNGTGSINLNSPTVIISDALQHAGDTNNQLLFGTDTQDFQTSGSSRLDLSDLGVRMGGTGARITSISDDTTMASDSSTLSVTQHAAKTYADSVGGASVTLTNAGTTSLVNDGIGPGLATKGLVNGSGISFSTSATDVTITNSAPDQTVSITDSNGLTIGGTYPNFTIGITAPVSIANGGTNATSVGAAGTLATSDGTKYTFTSYTFPSAATQGDILYASASNVWSSLAKNTTATRYLSNTGTINSPAWAAIDLSNGTTGTLGATSGGTAQSTYTTGDILYASATNTLSKLAIGSSTQVLTVSGGVPTWATPSGVGLTFNAVSSSTQALAINNSYYTTYAGLNVMTLPSTAAAGSIIQIIAGPSGNTFKVAQNSGQLIYYGAQNGVSQVTTTGTGGSLQSTDPNTSVTLICIVANTTWAVLYNINYLTIT